MSTVKELLQLQKRIFLKKDLEIRYLKNKLMEVEKRFQDQLADAEKLDQEVKKLRLKNQKRRSERILKIKEREARRCKPRCLCCKDRVTSVTSVTSTKTGQTFEVKPQLTCNSEFTIYLLSCRHCTWRYCGRAKKGVRIRSQGHRREVKRNIGALGLHFNKTGPCKDAGYSMIILDQATDYKMSSLKFLEGFYSLQVPEVFESGNKRLEGQNIRESRKRKKLSVQ